jgi:hypothetical protein
MKTKTKLAIGIFILILILYFGIVFYLVYINQNKDNFFKTCNLTDCRIFDNYNFNNAVNNMDNDYNISINKLRDLIENGT